MHTRFIPRLLVLSLMLTLVFAQAIHFKAAASDQTRWTDSLNVEDALVQACYGFNVTGSYTADRATQVVENYDGSLFYERRDVTFTGALGNAASGKSYAYDGQFTRISSPGLEKPAVSNLSLRFEVDTPGEFSVSLKRVEFDLSDDPHAVVKAIVPNVLHMDLCQLFGDSTIGYGPITPSSHPSADMSDGFLALPQWTDDDTEQPALVGSDANDGMTPWTELDPCDTTPSGKPC
jgi:hypothetical protein